MDQSAAQAGKAQQGRGLSCPSQDLSNTYMYRRVSMLPYDQHLLGIKRQAVCVVYHNKALPFVLRLAPKLLTAMAGGLAKATACRGIPAFLSHLDNFLCSPSASPAAAEALRVAIPSTQLTWFLNSPWQGCRSSLSNQYSLPGSRHRFCQSGALATRTSNQPTAGPPVEPLS